MSFLNDSLIETDPLNLTVPSAMAPSRMACLSGCCAQASSAWPAYLVLYWQQNM